MISSEKVLDELQTIAGELNDAQDLDYVLRLILKRGSELLDAAVVDLFTVDKQTGDLRAALTTREGGVPENIAILPRGQGLCGWVAKKKRTAIVGDVRHDLRFKGDDEVRSNLAIPLTIGGGVIGVLNFEDPRENAFNHFHQKLLEGLAVYASVALQRLWDHQILLALQRIDQAILDSGLDRKETLHVLLGEGDELLQPIKCHIAIYHPQDETLEIVAAKPKEAEGKRIKLDECVSGEAVRTGRLVVVSDVEKDSRYHDTGQPDLHIKSEIVAPLKDDGRVVGVFNMENAYEFSGADCRCLEVLAHQAAISLKTADLAEEQKRQNRELEALRRIDEAILDPSCDLDEILSLILEEVLILLDSSHGYLFSRKDQGLKLRAHWGEGSGTSEGTSLGEGICGQVLRSGEPRWVADLLEGTESAESSQTPRSELVYPFKENGRILGVLDARSTVLGFFDISHVQILNRLADPIVMAIRNAEQQDLILKVGEIIADINSASDISETLERILESTLELLKIANGLILVTDEASNELVVKIARGRARTVLGKTIKDSPILGDVLETGKSVLTPGKSIWSSNNFLSCGVLAAPLIVQGKVEGIVYLESQGNGFFSARHQNSIELLAGGAAIALENSKNRQQAHRSALWEGIRHYNHDLLHWIVNKATPMQGSAERLWQDLVDGESQVVDWASSRSASEELEGKRHRNHVRPTLSDARALESVKEDLQMILSNAEELLDVQRSFKKMSSELKLVRFQIAEVVQESIEKQVLERSCVSLDIEDDLPEVLGDICQTKMILENLLKNAVEAMANSEPKELRVAARKNPGENVILLTIADNGCGIEPEHRERIWDPLFTTKSEGTGIGLAVSYEVLKRMGCTVRVDSWPGKGSEFFLGFPLGENLS